VLFENWFGILPDESHLAKNNSEPAAPGFDLVEAMRADPEPIAVLFGDRKQPYVRADPYFMRVPDGDAEAREALDAFIEAMDQQMADIHLEDGDLCFIHNHRVVHGRKPFKARHDGTDCWLKRINVTSDLRRSRAVRPSLESRAVI
jgi:Taurine catabolism dioxygenase TauD, TfdA family